MSLLDGMNRWETTKTGRLDCWGLTTYCRAFSLGTAMALFIAASTTPGLYGLSYRNLLISSNLSSLVSGLLQVLNIVLSLELSF